MGILRPRNYNRFDTGIIIKEIRGSQGKPLSNGMFIVGLEGYDVFDSWLYNQNAELVQTWRSYGHYLIDESNNIRVIEQDRNTPTNSHVVSLRMDGSIKKGEKLINCTTSEPILTRSNNIIFEDSGIIRIIDSDLKEISRSQLLEITSDKAWLFTSNLKLIGK